MYTIGSIGTAEVRLDEFYHIWQCREKLGRTQRKNLQSLPSQILTYILAMQGKTGETPEEKPAKPSLPTTDLI